MVELWKEGFDHYGVGSGFLSNPSGPLLRMLEGAWAEARGAQSFDVSVPNFEINPNKRWLKLKVSNENFGGIRRVFGNTIDEVFVAVRFRLTGLPQIATHFVAVADSLNTVNVSLKITPVGEIQAVDAANNQLGISQQIIQSGTSTHLEFRVKKSTGILEVRIDEVTVMSLNGVTFTGNDPAQLFLMFTVNPGTTSLHSESIYFRDVFVRDTSGNFNNTWGGDLGVATIFPASDGALQGWTPRPLRNLSTGILDVSVDVDSYVFASDAADLELGAADYTIEGFFRFKSLPTGSDFYSLIQKWSESGNLRSWQLLKAGPNFLNGHLVFRISTDGTAATIANIHSQPFDFEVGRWYHIAISRVGGVSRLFVDGVQLGTSKTDNNTYFDGTASLRIGGTASTEEGRSLDGYVDEVRLTVGVGRYVGNFIPPNSPFPRDATDPNWANVVLLSGFDSGLNDESSVGRTITSQNSAAIFAPTDGDFAYQVIDDPDPDDTTFIEAALIAADAVLTVTANPQNGETVTIDTQTYTFVNTLANANDVLIGVDASTTLDNLVAAINGDAGEGTIYGTGTVAHQTVVAERLPDLQIKVIAKTAGSAGNSIAVSETLVNGSWDGATLSGGQDIPGPSDFVFGPLPREVTGVRSVTIVTRAMKTDAGPSQLQVSIVGKGGGELFGADATVSSAFSYREDVFEVDPDAPTAALTPAALTGMKFKVNRTV